MFYLLYGPDTYSGKEKLNELISHFKTKISNLGFFRIDGEYFKETEFEELLKAKTLFEKKSVVICDELLGNKELRGFVVDNLKKCAESENIFLFRENELDEETSEKFKKYAAKIQEFKPLSGAKLVAWFAAKKIPINIAADIIKKCGSDLWCASKEIEKYELGGKVEINQHSGGYNPFAICDAFAEKNRTKTWILLQQAAFFGIPIKDVFYKILWQIKNLLLVKKLKNAGVANIAKETGLHPFVASKALNACKNFTEEELINYSGEMIRIYHEERRGMCELPIELEKMLIIQSF